MAQGMKRDTALKIAQLSKHQLYHQPKRGKRGIPKSQRTKYIDEQVIVQEVSNEKVVERIISYLSDPDTDYGYRKMCFCLQHEGYLINHKKVYRLMHSQGLLKQRSKRANKDYVKYRVVTPEAPLRVLEMDIKQVWLEKHRRYAFILTIIDTFTRVVLGWKVGMNMKQKQVKELWTEVIVEHLQPANLLQQDIHIEIRNDNGPQFGAKSVQDFFEQNSLQQVFTHPYTPQENGHIESFHAILATDLNRRTIYDFEQLQEALNDFYHKYNNTRLHASIAHLPPNIFWKLWDKGHIERKKIGYKKVKFYLKIKRYMIKNLIVETAHKDHNIEQSQQQKTRQTNTKRIEHEATKSRPVAASA